MAHYISETKLRKNMFSCTDIFCPFEIIFPSAEEQFDSDLIFFSQDWVKMQIFSQGCYKSVLRSISCFRSDNCHVDIVSHDNIKFFFHFQDRCTVV